MLSSIKYLMSHHANPVMKCDQYLKIENKASCVSSAFFKLITTKRTWLLVVGVEIDSFNISYMKQKNHLYIDARSTSIRCPDWPKHENRAVNNEWICVSRVQNTFTKCNWLNFAFWRIWSIVNVTLSASAYQVILMILLSMTNLRVILSHTSRKS